MNSCPIGVFDSGVGGLSVFSQLVKLLPEEDYIYFGDTLNLPYGNKSKEQLVEITDNIFNFFKQKNVKAVVMACNTTSAVTYDILKNKYDFKIYPIVQNVSKQIALQGHKKIGVFATNATINSHAYQKEIHKYNPHCQVFEQSCPTWVHIVEDRLQSDEKCIEQVKQDLEKMLVNNVDKIILGCTHYPYLLEILEKYEAADKFINPAKYFAEYIKTDLENSKLLNAKRSYEPEFFVSANPKQFIEAAKLFYNVKEAKEFQPDNIALV